MTNTEKTLGNTTASQAKDNVQDIQFAGDMSLFKLLSKAWSENEKWMKSTKAMEVPGGVIVQVSSQQGDNLAEAVTFVPNVAILKIKGNYFLAPYSAEVLKEST